MWSCDTLTHTRTHSIPDSVLSFAHPGEAGSIQFVGGATEHHSRGLVALVALSILGGGGGGGGGGIEKRPTSPMNKKAGEEPSCPRLTMEVLFPLIL